MDGFWIILTGSHGGELDREFAEREDQIKPTMIALIDRCEINAGDKVSVEEGWSER